MRASTKRRLPSGEIRPTTETRSATRSAALQDPPEARGRRAERPPSMPASLAIAAAVSGSSPERTLSATPSRRKYSTVLACLGAQALGQNDEGEQLELGRRPVLGAVRVERAAGFGEREHAAPAAASRLRRVPRAVRARSRSGAPSRKRPALEGEPAPAPTRREGHLSRRGSTASAGSSSAIASSVALRVGADAAKTPERGCAPSRPRGPRPGSARRRGDRPRSASRSCRGRRRRRRRGTRPRSAAGREHPCGPCGGPRPRR